MKRCIIALIVMGLSSCTTYRLKSEKHQAKDITNKENIFLTVNVDRIKSLSCPFEKQTLEYWLRFKLENRQNINLVESRNAASKEVFVSVTCDVENVSGASGWAFLFTLSLIPMNGEQGVYTSIQVNDLKNRKPSTVTRDGEMIKSYMGLYFPTPLFVGDMSESTHQDMAERLTNKVVGELQ